MRMITYQFLNADEFYSFYSDARKILFEDNFDFNIFEVMSLEEKEKSKALGSILRDMKEYYLVAKDGERIIGWSFGIQKSQHDFYMINSAVFPEYRRRGIYTEMLHRAVDKIKEFGFQHIYSRHKMSNNNILIPKLKFGFVITGMEVTDMFGNLVQLSYYTNQKRKELLGVRMGMRKMNEEYLRLVSK